MKKIPLTQSQFTIVDGKNCKWLNQYKWYAHWDGHNFYAIRNGVNKNGKRIPIRMHREILGLKRGDKRQVDHINHKTLDNRECNLRIVDGNQNQWNQKNRKGYWWNNRDKKYQAAISIYGKRIYLGYFNTAKEARKAYLKAKKLYHRIEN